jgi:hypothetical protein
VRPCEAENEKLARGKVIFMGISGNVFHLKLPGKSLLVAVFILDISGCGGYT